MLAKQEEKLARVRTCTLGYAQRSCLVNWVNTVELLVRHRVHHVNEFANAISGLFLLAFGDHVCVEARNHADNIAERAHVEHAAELVTHVTQSELAGLYLVDDVLLLARGHCIVDCSNQSSHITQAKQPFDEAIGVKGLEVFKMLACAEEDNRALRCSDRAQRASTFRVTVELSYDDGADSDSLLESLGLGKAGLSNATVHDEHASVWLDALLHLDHLIEESRLLSMSSRSVHNNNLIVVLTEVSYASLCDLYWVSLLLISVEWALDLSSVHLQLCESTGTESICAHDTHFPPLLHVVIRKLGASGRLTGTLQTDKHDNVRLATLELLRLVAA